MSSIRSHGGRPGQPYALACGIVATEKIVSKKASRRIFEPVGEYLQNELNLNPGISLEKNKKRIKLDPGKQGKSD